MAADQRLNPLELCSGETTAALQSDRLKPEFRHPILPLYMDVPWLAPIRSLEEETVRAYGQDGRHWPPGSLNSIGSRRAGIRSRAPSGRTSRFSGGAKRPPLQPAVRRRSAAGILHQERLARIIHEILLRHRICPHLLRCASSSSSTYCIEYAFVGRASRALQLRASPMSRDGFHE